MEALYEVMGFKDQVNNDKSFASSIQLDLPDG